MPNPLQAADAQAKQKPAPTAVINHILAAGKAKESGDAFAFKNAIDSIKIESERDKLTRHENMLKEKEKHRKEINVLLDKLSKFENDEQDRNLKVAARNEIIAAFNKGDMKRVRVLAGLHPDVTAELIKIGTLDEDQIDALVEVDPDLAQKRHYDRKNDEFDPIKDAAETERIKADADKTTADAMKDKSFAEVVEALKEDKKESPEAVEVAEWILGNQDRLQLSDEEAKDLLQDVLGKHKESSPGTDTEIARRRFEATPNSPLKNAMTRILNDKNLPLGNKKFLQNSYADAIRDNEDDTQALHLFADKAIDLDEKKEAPHRLIVAKQLLTVKDIGVKTGELFEFILKKGSNPSYFDNFTTLFAEAAEDQNLTPEQRKLALEAMIKSERVLVDFVKATSGLAVTDEEFKRLRLLMPAIFRDRDGNKATIDANIDLLRDTQRAFFENYADKSVAERVMEVRGWNDIKTYRQEEIIIKGNMLKADPAKQDIFIKSLINSGGSKEDVIKVLLERGYNTEEAEQAYDLAITNAGHIGE